MLEKYLESLRVNMKESSELRCHFLDLIMAEILSAGGGITKETSGPFTACIVINIGTFKWTCVYGLNAETLSAAYIAYITDVKAHEKTKIDALDCWCTEELANINCPRHRVKD